jgi:hypothetical protein
LSCLDGVNIKHGISLSHLLCPIFTNVCQKLPFFRSRP